MASDSLADSLAVPGIFLDTISASAIAFIVEMIIFLALFKHHGDIYWPRLTRVEPAARIFDRPTSAFGWVKPLFTSNNVILQKCGFDSYLYVRFLTMVNQIMLCLALSAAPVLVLTDMYGCTESPLPGLFRFSIGNISFARLPLLWVHVGVTIGVIVFVCALIRREQNNYVKKRHIIRLLPDHRIKPSCRTILVRNIPSYQLSEMALNAVFGMSNGGIRKITICTDVARMQMLAYRRGYWVTRLEDGELLLIERAQRLHESKAKSLTPIEWEGSGRMLAEGIGIWSDGHGSLSENDASEESDSESVLHHEIQGSGYAMELERVSEPHDRLPKPMHLWKAYMSRREYWDEIDHPRRELARVNDMIRQSETAMYARLRCAFITFNLVEDAMVTCARQLSETMEYATVEMALHPKDVRWFELAQSSRYAFCATLSHLHLFTYSFLTYLVLSSLLNSILLAAHTLAKGPLSEALRIPLPLLGLFLHCVSAWTWQIMGLAWVFVAEFRAMGEQIPASRVRIGCRVQSLSLVWMLWVSLAVGIVPHDVVSDFIGVFKALDVFSHILFKATLQASNGALFYQLIAALQSTAGAFLRPQAILIRHAPVLSSTPRDVWMEKTILPFVDWPLAYNPLSSLLASGLACGVVSPLLIPATAAAGLLVSMGQRYTLLYIETPEYDTNGAHFLRALDHVFFGLYCMEAITCFMIATLARDVQTYLAVVVLGIAVVCTAVFQVWSWKTLHAALNNFDRRGSSSSSTNEHPANTAVRTETRNSGVTSLLDLSESEREVLVDNAYKHPGAKVRSATAWLPRDHVGVSDDEILMAGHERFGTTYQDQDGRARTVKFVPVSNDGAAIGHKGKVIIAKEPPDWCKYDDVEL